jgi:hypothetical protein
MHTEAAYMSFYLPDGCTQDMLDSRRKYERQALKRLLEMEALQTKNTKE